MRRHCRGTRMSRLLRYRDTSGKVVRVLARARDVTDQRRIKRDLRERESDFRTLAEFERFVRRCATA